MARRKAEQISKPIIASGKRKTAIAKATLTIGTGKILINHKPLDKFSYFHKLILSEPLSLARTIIGDKLNEINLDVEVRGSGTESQIEAIRLAIARVLVFYTKSSELKNTFLKYDRSLLVADTRRKEQRKPNDSKARAARQKSYR